MQQDGPESLVYLKLISGVRVGSDRYETLCIGVDGCNRHRVAWLSPRAARSVIGSFWQRVQNSFPHAIRAISLDYPQSSLPNGFADELAMRGVTVHRPHGSPLPSSSRANTPKAAIDALELLIKGFLARLSADDTHSANWALANFLDKYNKRPLPSVCAPAPKTTANNSYEDLPTRILNIAFRLGGARYRTVVSRANARPSFKMGSVKNATFRNVSRVIIEASSENELNVCGELECNWNVIEYREQPCKITYIDGTEEKEHIPDAGATQRLGGKVLLEVKEKTEAGTDEVKRRTEILTCDLPYHGYSYELRIAEDAAREPACSNRWTIISFATRPVSDYEREIIRRVCEFSGHVLWGEACKGAYGPFGREIVCRLFIEGSLTADLDKPLSPSTAFFARMGVM